MKEIHESQVWVNGLRTLLAKVYQLLGSMEQETCPKGFTHDDIEDLMDHCCYFISDIEEGPQEAAGDKDGSL